MSKVRESLSPFLSFFKLEKTPSVKNILLASLSGIYIHILLDSRMHIDIHPFYPIDFNSLLNSNTPPGLWIYMLYFRFFIGALVIYVIKFLQICKKVKVNLLIEHHVKIKRFYNERFILKMNIYS